MRTLYHATIGLSMGFAALCAVSEPAHSQEGLQLSDMPISIQTWQSLSPEARSHHARVSVQALKWSGEFATCTALKPEALAHGIEAAIAGHFADEPATAVMEPLILAAMQICPMQG